jgi:hypothetical protein
MIVLIFIFLIGFVVGHFFGSADIAKDKTRQKDAAQPAERIRTISSKDCTYIKETNTYIWIPKEKYE